MAVNFLSDFIGDYQKDAIMLSVKGDRGKYDIKIYTAYEVKTSVLTQPSAFSFRIGNGEQARELRKLIYKGDECQLSVDGYVLQSGIVEAVNVPEAEYTELDIKGRDWMAPFVMSNILNEYTFNEPTYFELVKRIMKIVGVGDRELISSNDANRLHLAHIGRQKKRRRLRSGALTASPKAANTLVEQVPTGMTGVGGAKVVLEALHARIGQSWYQWLDKQLKLTGMLLWASGDGRYILSAPNAKTDPWYRIVRRRGQTREETNIIKAGLKDDSTNEHTSVIVNAHYGAGLGGRQQASSAFVNFNAAQTLGDFRPLTIEDNDVKTPQEALYRAKRAVSEERRAAFQLTYTMSGHRMPSTWADDQMAFVICDSVVAVDDDELDIHGNMYIESVTYRRGPETSMTLELMVPQDLNYFADIEATE